MMRLTCAFGAALFGASAACGATFSYNEAIDGDGSDTFAAASILATLEPGDDLTILGTVGAPDSRDYFGWTSTGVTNVSLTSLLLTGSNASTGFPIYDVDGFVLVGFGSDGTGLPTSIATGLAPGTYFVRPAENSSDVSTYTLEITATPVPVPAAFGLLVAGLGALTLLRARRD